MRVKENIPVIYVFTRINAITKRDTFQRAISIMTHCVNESLEKDPVYKNLKYDKGKDSLVLFLKYNPTRSSQSKIFVGLLDPQKYLASPYHPEKDLPSIDLIKNI